MSEFEEQDGLKIQKYDYLQGKYVFRYPYTITSIKWGLTLGSFFGIHTYIKTRNVRKSFFNWIEKTVILTFAVWAYFYSKYNFYQNSINDFQQEEDSKIRQANFLKKYLEYKLHMFEGATMPEQQLLKEYQMRCKEQLEKNRHLDIMLRSINATSFDVLPFRK